MQRGSLIWTRTLSLQLWQRDSLLDLAWILSAHLGQVSVMGIEVSKEDCSPSPGFGAKIAMAPVAMVDPAVMIAAMAMSRAAISSKVP